MTDPAQIVRSYFEACPARDRAAIEAVVAEDFHFTSPLDNRIERRTYFDRCWPGGDDMAELDLQHAKHPINATLAQIKDLTGTENDEAN